MTATERRRGRPHALRVKVGSAAFRDLFAALAASGERAGWLELDPDATADAAGGGAAGEPWHRPGSGFEAPALESTLADGAWKAVGVAALRTVVAKSRRGPAVLDDLLREHFRGCRVVLVRGGGALPELRPSGAGWELDGGAGAVRRLTTAELVRALRAPRLAV